MKKIYLSAIALSLATLSFGQHAIPNKSAAPILKTEKNSTENNKAPGDTLWSDDFSTIGNWALTNASSPAQDWIYETDPTAIPVLTPNAVNFTTAANGFLYIDSDDLGGASTQNSTAQTVTAIDLSAEAAVSLNWEQQFISFQEVFTVSVSGDNGTSWTDYVIDGGGLQANTFQSKSLNISAVAGGQSQVLVKFNYQGNWDWMWAIDDVSIIATPLNELVLDDPYYGSLFYQYSQIPVAQIQPIDFAAFVQNIGNDDQPNTILSLDINSGAFTSATAPVTVVSGTTDSLFTVWTPAATAGNTYTATLSVEASPLVDFSPANNTYTFAPFSTTDHIYAYDDNDVAADQGRIGGDNGGEVAFEGGNSFDIFVDANLMALDVVVGAGTPVGANFKGVLYEGITTAPFYSKIAETQFYVTDAASIGNITQLLFNAPIALEAGKNYFAGVSVLSEFYISTSGGSPGQDEIASPNSFYSYGTMDSPSANKNYYTTSTPMVRMNFDPSLPVGVAELKGQVKFNVFPNPSNGVFNINLSSNDNVNLTVKNVVGQTVITETVNVSGNTNHKISLTDYSKGIYFLTVGTETVKLIVE